MRNNLLKTVALLTLLVLFMSLVVNATTYTEKYFYYIVEDNGITITGYFGNEETVTVPNQIAGVPVSKIASGAFVDTTVKELYLPDTIMTIELGAIEETIKVHTNFVEKPTVKPTETTQSSRPADTSNTSKPSTTAPESGIVVQVIGADSTGSNYEGIGVDNGNIDLPEETTGPTSNETTEKGETTTKVPDTTEKGGVVTTANDDGEKDKDTETNKTNVATVIIIVTVAVIVTAAVVLLVLIIKKKAKNK